VDKYVTTATDLLPCLGGAGNITALTHCVTRLRLDLAQRGRVDDAALRAHPAVLGVREAEQFQVIVGPAVVAKLAHALAALVAQGQQTGGWQRGGRRDQGNGWGWGLISSSASGASRYPRRWGTSSSRGSPCTRRAC
jgi:sucrose PTS system EIIBCA or EIIBC component